MKILYISRLFTGLESSFINRKWSPTGVPTIFKMIEVLDRDFKVNFLFTVKDSGRDFKSNWKLNKDAEIVIDGLKNNIKILTGTRYFSLFGRSKITIFLREFRHFLIIYFKILTYKPNIIYIDNSNIFSAALITKIFRKKFIILRIMGVYPYMKSIINSKRFIDRINLYAYRSNFSLVVCTQDGSGVTKWCSDVLNKNTKYKILINGINKEIKNTKIDPNLNKIPQNKYKILFIGKLEEYKGIKEFVSAMYILENKYPKIFHAVIIGNGNESMWLKETIKKNNSEKLFTVIDKINHEQIFHAHNNTNIYVSLNRYGNLSNVNLEAVYFNNCMIIPESNKTTGVDLETDTIINKDSVIRIKLNNIDENLSNMIIKLYNNPQKRMQIKESLKNLSFKIIKSWDQRIEDEIQIIKDKYEKTKL